VPAMPASSMTTRVLESMSRTHWGMGSWVRDQVSLARVSVREPICSRSIDAATAEGARPMTVPPPSVQARARAAMAVVLPDPAGAIASWSRAPEVAISRTSCAWAGFRVTPFAADSSSATSTTAAGTAGPSVRSAAATRRASASMTACEVNSAAPATV